MKRIGFVILTWNSQNYIKQCLESIMLMADNNFILHIVVIDNDSQDETRNLIGEMQQLQVQGVTLDFIGLSRNYGTTKSRNIGLMKIMTDYDNTDYICILDSDTEINKKALLVMLEELDSFPQVGIIGPRMHSVDGTYQDSGRNTPTLSEKIYKVLPVKRLQSKALALQKAIPSQGKGTVRVGYLMSACWMMRTDTIRTLGLLDENIFYAPEDADYCMTCWDKGMEVRYCYDADILHHWQRLSRKKLFSKHNYEHIKGLIYLFRKHGHAFSPYKI